MLAALRIDKGSLGGALYLGTCIHNYGIHKKKLQVHLIMCRDPLSVLNIQCDTSCDKLGALLRIDNCQSIG